MGSGPKSWKVTYAEIARVSGLGERRIRTAVNNHDLDPADLENLITWIVHHGLHENVANLYKRLLPSKVEEYIHKALKELPP